MLLSIMPFSFDLLMVLCDNIHLILSENGKPGAIPGRKVMGPIWVAIQPKGARRLLMLRLKACLSSCAGYFFWCLIISIGGLDE